MKSPENDGFTTEFYNFFWINVKQILIMSFYESYSEQKILLAKHMCSKRRKILILLKNNWRPITLLNIDLKICLATISKIDCSKPSFGRFIFCIKLSFCSWIKTFYNDSSCSDYFKLGRAVRQSVPLCCLFLVTSFISTGSN